MGETAEAQKDTAKPIHRRTVVGIDSDLLEVVDGLGYGSRPEIINQILRVHFRGEGKLA